MTPDTAKPTPGAEWRENGEPDPHGTRYDCERRQLVLGHLADDELANEVFLKGDSRTHTVPINDLLEGREFMSGIYLTAAKDRIRWLSRRVAALSAVSAPDQPEYSAEDALRSLACWLGVGGYNAPTVDAKLYERKIVEGITTYSQLHGFAARDLAETVLHMDLITPKGIRARELARKVLGLVPMGAAATPNGLPTTPTNGKTTEKNDGKDGSVSGSAGESQKGDAT